MNPRPTPMSYSEHQLVTNRAAVLLFGASEELRLKWAEEAAEAFAEEGPLQRLTEPEEQIDQDEQQDGSETIDHRRQLRSRNAEFGVEIASVERSDNAHGQ